MKPEDDETTENPPDGRGNRAADPNELAKWIVDRSTDDENGG